MCKESITENGIDFKELEREIFEIDCQTVQGILVEVLENLDQRLNEARDKKKYRNKGKRKPHLSAGSVPFAEGNRAALY